MKADQNIPDGIYYIVIADLVGSTKVGAKWANAVLADRSLFFVQEAKRALEHAKMSSNSGRFIKSIGDAVLVVFSHFPDVVQWRMEFNGLLDLAKVGQEPFQARICVHAGELRFDEGDVSGLAVNQVCKMEKKVAAGDMVLSEIAHTLAAPSVYPKQCEFEEYKTVRLVGYARPVKLYRLGIKASLAFLIEKTAHGRLIGEKRAENKN